MCAGGEWSPGGREVRTGGGDCNSLGAGEGNRDDNQVLHRYGVKEKNER